MKDRGRGVAGTENVSGVAMVKYGTVFDMQ